MSFYSGIETAMGGNLNEVTDNYAFISEIWSTHLSHSYSCEVCFILPGKPSALQRYYL